MEQEYQRFCDLPGHGAGTTTLEACHAVKSARNLQSLSRSCPSSPLDHSISALYIFSSSFFTSSAEIVGGIALMAATISSARATRRSISAVSLLNWDMTRLSRSASIMMSRSESTASGIFKVQYGLQLSLNP